MFLLIVPVMSRAQLMDNRRVVDTLSIADRIALKTNAVDWFLLTPNIGAEFDLRNTNWSKWTIGANIRGNWNTRNTFTQDLVYNVIAARVELRNYWRMRKTESNEPKGFLKKMLSPNRISVKHPTTVYYRGVYVDYSKYSILLSSKGHQGTAICAGLLLGMVKPLYEFSNGNSLDFEMGVALGACYTKYDVYKHDREDDCYPVTDSKPAHFLLHPVINDLRIGFVYRLGNYPITKKYRARQDVDLVYADTLTARNDRNEQRKSDEKYRTDITTKIENDFNRAYQEQISIGKQAKANLEHGEKENLKKSERKEDKK